MRDEHEGVMGEHEVEGAIGLTIDNNVGDSFGEGVLGEMDEISGFHPERSEGFEFVEGKEQTMDGKFDADFDSIDDEKMTTASVLQLRDGSSNCPSAPLLFSVSTAKIEEAYQ